MIDKINKLKKEKNAIILAHYYVDDEIQKIADYVGDSFYLAKKAKEVNEDTIVFCGVYFMGESAKILNPNKTVVMPDLNSDCPMAHMVTVDEIENMKKKVDDLAVVCYINSTAKIKAASDVCVTSSNAVKIVKNLPQKNIFFVPDKNLGHFVSKMLPEKNFYFNDGYCPIHNKIEVKNLKMMKKKYPDAKVLSHPECRAEILAESDFVGSTSMIIEYAKKSDSKKFIIGTETGVFYELYKNNNIEKQFYPIEENQLCPGMKLITLEKIVNCLENIDKNIQIKEVTRLNALKALDNMFKYAK